ncbi:MAG: hypothetical protein QW468_05250 [Candidatus Bathyarchaeia archaeon]
MPKNWRQPLIWILKANVIAVTVDIVFLALLVALMNLDVLALIRDGYFPKMLLLEAGIVFLIGGAIAMSASIFPSKVREHFLHSREEWSMEKLRKGEKKANLYILTGIILFIECIITSYLVL